MTNLNLIANTSVLSNRFLQMGVVALMGLLLLTGCGAQKMGTGSSEQASLLEDSAEKPVAFCTSDRGLSSAIGMQSMVYRDQNGPRYDMIRARLTRFASSISMYAIKFTAAEIDSRGVVLSRPFVKFTTERKISDQFTSYPLADANSETLLWSDAQNIAVKMGFTANTPNDFFSRSNFAITLPDASDRWSVLTISVYADNNANSVPNNLSMLIPPHYANPADHAENKSELVKSLHPFFGITDWSLEKYKSESEKYCF